MKKKLSRRNFLSSAAAVGAFTIVPRHVLGGKNYTAPSSKVNIAGIGVGGMGFNNLKALQSQNIVALCDVDHKNAGRAFKKFPNAARYKDYRLMLENQKDIDAVLIATPDHTHAHITIAAMKAGKHVFTQKPMAHTPIEARQMTRVAKETGVVTQMGIQGHSQGGLRRICEWIWDGAIGEVEKVDAWCSLAYYPPGQAYWCTTHYDIPKEKPPVPEGMDWDLWLGPAPYRDFHPTYHPGRWRAWYDFGCGMMGDRGVHTFDSIVSALKLKQPTAVSATVSNLNNQTHPISSIVDYYFDARENLAPIKVTWYEGIEAPRPDDLEDKRRMYSQGGVVFKGTKASIMCGVYGNDPRIIPEVKHKAYKQPEPTLPRIKTTHEMEWINAIRENRKASADFEYSGPLTETVLLGNLAKRVRTKIYYDAENMKITNNDKANTLMHKEYRTGW